MVLASIGGVLFIAASAYTWWLSKVRPLYEPDDTHIVATVGFGLIEAAVLAACLAGELPIKAFWVLFGFSIIAAIPIYVWREREKRIQRRKRDAAERN
jgi:hypothetical protein